jgi:hypothetical protein
MTTVLEIENLWEGSSRGMPEFLAVIILETTGETPKNFLSG